MSCFPILLLNIVIFPSKERTNIYHLSLIGHDTVNLCFKSWKLWGLSGTLLEMCGNRGPY